MNITPMTILAVYLSVGAALMVLGMVIESRQPDYERTMDEVRNDYRDLENVAGGWDQVAVLLAIIFAVICWPMAFARRK